MSIIAAYNEAWDNGDVDALANIIHDDCVFNPHVGGITMSKSDILGFVSGGSPPKGENQRILFENDEVGVAHSIVHLQTIPTLRLSCPSCDSKTEKSSLWKPVLRHFQMITNSLEPSEEN